MTDILLLVSAIAILQTGGAYVRYMPFAGIMDAKTKRRLFYTDCLVLLFNMSWMALLVDRLGLNVFTYKCCLTLGWIPFFLSMFFIFPNAKAAQIFILGMQGIYMFALHGISAIFILLVFPDTPAENFLIEHLFVYDFFFAMTLPGAYRVFSPMLPSKRFMNEKSYSYYIAAIPMILVTAATPTSLLGELWSIDKLFVWVKMVSQTGEQLGDLKKRPEMGNVSRDPARRRQKEDAGVRSQRLLITWMSTSEQLYRNITRYVKPEDFTDELCQKAATLLGTQMEQGHLNPAALFQYFEEGEEQERAAAMFNDSIPALKSREKEKKALQETILRVKQNSIAWQTEHMDPGDMNALQEIVRKRREIEKLHISLD